MCKIVQISDIHWRPIQRHDEYTKAFEMLFEQIKEIKPDLIINTGDFYHLKTAQISSEVIEKMCWAFKELARFAPVYSILGNHDLNLTNPNRSNIIRTIHDILNDKNIVLLDKSKTETLYVANKNIALHPFSLADKKNWTNLKPLSDYINIALFHGSIAGCKTDNNWDLLGCEENVASFKDFDFVFLGDIHKFQFLSERDTIIEINKHDLEHFKQKYPNLEIIDQYE